MRHEKIETNFTTDSGGSFGSCRLPNVQAILAKKPGEIKWKTKAPAKQAEILIRGLAHVGIIALVDEATGYQEIRDKRALEKILDAYLQKELAAWAKRFPDEFYNKQKEINMLLSPNEPQISSSSPGR